jgi:ABC-type uncharacterized transport system permease subunit
MKALLLQLFPSTEKRQLFFYGPDAPFSSLLVSVCAAFGFFTLPQAGVLLWAQEPLTDLLIVRKPWWAISMAVFGGLFWWAMERARYGLRTDRISGDQK